VKRRLIERKIKRVFVVCTFSEGAAGSYRPLRDRARPAPPTDSDNKMPPKQPAKAAPAAAAKPKKVEAPVLSEEEQKLLVATTEALNDLIEKGKDVASELAVRLRSS
jgi:hypothetical protein